MRSSDPEGPARGAGQGAERCGIGGGNRTSACEVSTLSNNKQQQSQASRRTHLWACGKDSVPERQRRRRLRRSGRCAAAGVPSTLNVPEEAVN